MTATDGRWAHENNTMVQGNLLGLSSMLIWAFAFPAAEILLQTWDPMALTVSRFVISLLFLIPLWIWMDGWQKVCHAPWLRGILIGGPTFGLSAYLLLVSQDLTNAVTAAILASTLPIVSTLVELFAGERKLRVTFVIGLGLSVVGAVVATGELEVLSLGFGALAMFGSVVLFSLGSYLAVRSFPEATAMSRATLPLVGGMMMTVLISVAMIALGYDLLPTHAVDLADWGWLFVYALAGMAISQLLWIAAIGKIGVALASFHINATPLYVMVFMVLLGDVWQWQSALGAAIVIMGVIIAQLRKRHWSRTA